MQIIVDFESTRVEIPDATYEAWGPLNHKAKEIILLHYLKEQKKNTLSIEGWEVVDE